MVIAIIFIFLLFLENLFLPALVGPRIFLITPIFLASLIIYSQDSKKKLLSCIVMLFIAEIFSGHTIGSLLIPFVLSSIVYIWANNSLNITSGLRENYSFWSMIGSITVITLFIYLYSWFFIIFHSSYNILQSWIEWRILIENSLLQTLGWAFAFSIMLKHVIKNK